MTAGDRVRTFGLLFSAAIVGIGVVLIEIVLRMFAPVPDPYGPYKNVAVMKYLPGQFASNQHLTFHPDKGQSGMKQETHFTTNNRGLRGDDLVMPKAAGEFRIFTIGGSAMECLLLDDGESISDVLQRELRSRLGINVKVYGAAKSGAASFDDIAMVVHRLVYLQPDLVIDLTGVNDTLASIQRYDYMHYSEEMRLTLTFRYMATEFQIFRRLQSIAKRVIGSKQKSARQALEELPLNTNIRQKVEISRQFPHNAGRPDIDASFFEANLKTLVGVARVHGFQLVFMTQPSSWNSEDPRAPPWHWMTFGFKEEVLDGALDTMNDVTRHVTADTATPLYDLARELPKSMDFFYDDVHFNANGARTLGTQLAAFLEKEGLVSARMRER